MNDQRPLSSVLIIFGATGDLAKRKLYPSIYNLYKKGQLGNNFAVVGVARRPLSHDTFRLSIKESIETFSSPETDLDAFRSHFYYQPVDVTNRVSYEELRGLVTDLDKQYNIQGNRIFYLAMAPEFFGTIATHLDEERLTDTDGWKRLVIEKPFGHDLPSAKQLNDEVRKVFSEDEIYRIDHYLGKEMVQNIEVIRFANTIFEPLWNNRFISNIQITSSETIGVGERAGYYEQSGALRDMVQNHMLQVVSLLAMEPPCRLTTEDIRSEKVKVLKSLRPVHQDDVDDYFVRGQYGAGTVQNKCVTAYRDEEGVHRESNTETFVAGKLMIDNFRWAGVPFYIRTGKRLERKSTKIVVEFKDIPMNLYYNKDGDRGPNLLVIDIYPNEGITLHLNAKDSSALGGTTPISMEFSNKVSNTVNSPEAYERLIFDCLRGEATNFTRWDEVALSWEFIDPLSKAWVERSHEQLPIYTAGTMGPKQADELLQKDGFFWWPITH